MAGPQGEVVAVDTSQLSVKRSNVMDQAKILERVRVGIWRRVYAHLGEGKHASRLPVGNSGLNLRRPHEVRLVGRASTIRVRCRDIIVWASDLVLGAVAALGEVFIAANMTTLARLTALAGLGVAATRRTTTGTGHCCSRLGGSLLVGARDVKIPAPDTRAGMGSERS